jgi:hypothetical protein
LAKTLKNKRTAGPDDKPECLAKQCIGLLTHTHIYIYRYIYNLSSSLGVFPENWKTAKVTPLYKKGDRYDVQNYRPICKVNEKIDVQKTDDLFPGKWGINRNSGWI